MSVIEQRTHILAAYVGGLPPRFNLGLMRDRSPHTVFSKVLESDDICAVTEINI